MNANAIAFTQLSVVGVNGAFVAANDVNEIGSPGTIANVPEPGSVLLLVAGMATVAGLAKRRRVR